MPVTDITVVIPCYRDADRAVAATTAVHRQAHEESIHLECVVVDDGSGDETAKKIASLAPLSTKVIALPNNVGRSGARNVGVAASSSPYVIFMDCDCIPGRGFLTAHLSALRAGASGTFGAVFGQGDGFWDRYQKQSATSTAKQAAKGHFFVGSSQNMGVNAQHFHAVGGFDELFIQYGFEDRDLLIRLAAHGRVQWLADAHVEHHDTLTLARIVPKMIASGRYSAKIFGSRYPAAYRTLGYGHLDAELHAWNRLFALPLGPLCLPAARWVDALISSNRLPYALARPAVRAISALAFSYGTATRGR